MDGEDLVARCTGYDYLMAAIVCLVQPVHATATASISQTSADGRSNGVEADIGHRITTQHGDDAVTTSAVGAVGSWHWWAARTLMLQQNMLSGRSSTLFNALQLQYKHSLDWTTLLEAADDYQQVGQLLRAGVHLETAHMYHWYGYVEQGRSHLVRAGDVLGVQVREQC